MGLAGFGRAVAEVGAVIIVGGNIDHLTRVMTTAIALETSKGDLPLALALGIVLMTLALGVNALVQGLRRHRHALRLCVRRQFGAAIRVAAAAPALLPLEIRGPALRPLAERALIDGIDLDAPRRASITMVMGPNGAGKSLLLRLLHGLILPTRGRDALARRRR